MIYELLGVKESCVFFMQLHEEDVSQCQSPEELRAFLYDNMSDYKDYFDKSAIYIAILKEDTFDDEITKLTPEDFWNEYSQFFPQWREAGLRIQEEMERYNGKGEYWEINQNNLKVKSQKIDAQHDYDLRSSLLSGNCFLTEQDAEEFQGEIISLLKDCHAPDIDINAVRPCYTLSLSCLYDLCKSYSEREICIPYPINPVYIIEEIGFDEAFDSDYYDPEEYAELIKDARNKWNVFEDYYEAGEAKLALWNLFEKRGFSFIGFRDDTI